MSLSATSAARSSAIKAPKSAGALSIRELGIIIVQLALLLTLVWQFQLEGKRNLFMVLAMTLSGFIVHALLPLRYRLAWFLALSLGCLVVVLGPLQASYVLVIGCGLIAVTYLPIPFWQRIVILSFAAAGFVWLRNGSQAPFWPIVGSMFMFRLLVYMHSVHNQRGTEPFLKTCSYFFLLPNAFFPLFPVVDYKTFRSTYYNDDRCRIYQTGVHWMVLGTAHLLLYRLIKYELLPTPLEIRSAGGVALFLAMNYALYLRVSGQFHLICGILHLFGFNLPRTHNYYFLASSFSDIWRRINIYWKDFMMRVFFFRAFYRLERRGVLLALAAAVLWVFLWTWLLHSWQAFWLIGQFPLQARDAVLWLGAGTLVALSVVYRKAVGQRRAVPFSVTQAAIHMLKIIGVFYCISIFWAKWSLPPDTFRMLMVSDYMIHMTVSDLVSILGVLAVVIAAGVAVQYFRSRTRAGRLRNNVIAAILGKERLSFDGSARLHIVPMVLVLMVSMPPIYQTLGKTASQIIADLRIEKRSPGEAVAVIGGYYEQLNEESPQARPYLGKPQDPGESRGDDYMAMTQSRRDILSSELIPGWKGKFYGVPLTVNRWGSRDRDRTVRKSPGTYRIAVVGSSVIMGYGVADDETVTRILEDRLNAGSPDGMHYEVLNFGIGKTSPIRARAIMQRKVLPFQPDLILYCVHQDELYTPLNHLTTAIYNNVDLEDPCLDDLVKRAGITRDSSEGVIRSILQTRLTDILDCAYRRIAETCAAMGAECRFIYLPIPGDHFIPFDPRISIKKAKDTGLRTIDLTGWWGSYSVDDVILDKKEHHPSPLGHRLLATAFEAALRRDGDLSKETHATEQAGE